MTELVEREPPAAESRAPARGLPRVRLPTAVQPVAGIAAITGVLWLAWGQGFANYDALYSLLWGRQIAHGQSPSFGVTLAPTDHPLANLVGAILSPLGPRAGESALVALAFIALGAVGWLIFRLGQHWFGWPAGVLAAAIILTREPVLSYGTRAYADLPYLAFVLGALLLVARRPRQWGGPLALLILAGLIRPEAWLFALAYVAWLWWAGERRWEPILLAIAGPALWLIIDGALTGHPLRSLTGTQHNVVTLGRVTGLQHVPTTLPFRVGEILRVPVLVGGAGGALLTLWLTRGRARLPWLAAILAVVAYALLAAAGLPIITRYAFGIASLLAIFCGAAVFGWRLLERGHRWRPAWVAFAVLTVALLAGFGPSQASRLSATHANLAAQQRIEGDLWTVALPRCPVPAARGLGVVNHRLVPLIALRENVDPARVRPAPIPASFLGTYVGPANPRVARLFILDPRDPSQRWAAAPPFLVPVAGNRSWRVRQRCAPPVVMHHGE